MMKKLPFVFLFLILLSCEREVENPQVDPGLDYFPLFIGNFWVYEVSERTYFGENDFEDSQYFLKDRIRSLFVNDAGEQVFIVQRERSLDQINWQVEVDYTIVIRDNNLVMNLNNQPIVILAFPPKEGLIWNGNLYRGAEQDEFELIQESSGTSAEQIRVLQENEDDLITFRDIRYDVFQKGVGLTERYSEVLTYCSRNDCLGEQLIDSGRFLNMKLITYGNE
ncbi:hypothetical protein [Algoriphagus formosus]|uniref:hypothetical protein n=1 Tax=Algoriphagus formosus TaxID=2007308 RepID=UPI000C28E345|nr:hypothetical protein [Algoriphagus formosus]